MAKVVRLALRALGIEIEQRKLAENAHLQKGIGDRGADRAAADDRRFSRITHIHSSRFCVDGVSMPG